MTRRDFLKRTSVAVAGGSAVSLAGQVIGAEKPWMVAREVFLLTDPTDPIAKARPAQWGLAQLQEALLQGQVQVHVVESLTQVASASLFILAAGKNQPLADKLLERSRLRVPIAPECLALTSGKLGKRAGVLACGSDPRGLMYALLELADRVRLEPDGVQGLASTAPVVECPANPVRSNMRLFASDVEDKAWFYDQTFWRRYLTTLATERFNRFNLALGLGYDFPTDIRDAYFHFPYPFLVAVPGYDVRITAFSDAERERNLEMLRFISDETAARGLEFQLGLWTHAYRWVDSPRANHVIEGLTPDTHAAYCRDALGTLLKACPAISGVTFRVHGESGVAEGSYSFWKTVFQGLSQCGRPIGIDMHAKGIDAEMIAVALSTGQSVTISPKFWAEHLGLPYHQAAIRPTEMPPPGRQDQGFFSKSSGSRSFLRYGYGDLLAEGRHYQVVHRIWPGTQRLLLWGDPVFTAGYSRAASFCGSAGMEVFEPLSFKGRKGSGRPGGRDGYADGSLKAPAGDFEKYTYGYRLWGRLLYNPDTPAETWQRLLKAQYGEAAGSAESALSNASRILPLITTAHTPSAANNNFWPEMYTNMSIVDAKARHPYGDTPSPKRFGTVSPLDPQLFYRVDDFAEDLLRNQRSGKYSPLEVADWLLSMAETAEKGMQAARGQADAELASKRLAKDVAIQVNIGRFFAFKFRAAVYYALQQRTGYEPFLAQALDAYRAASQAWAQITSQTAGVYVPDITFGLEPQLRGHWSDRQLAIDEDLRKMQTEAPSPSTTSASVGSDTNQKVLTALSTVRREPSVRTEHSPASHFRRGQPLEIGLSISRPVKRDPSLSVRLFYRHVNQAEQFLSSEMARQGDWFHAVILPPYTDSAFPIQYYFELRDSLGNVWLQPELGPALNQQPYYVVRANRQGGGGAVTN